MTSSKGGESVVESGPHIVVIVIPPTVSIWSFVPSVVKISISTSKDDFLDASLTNEKIPEFGSMVSS
jgi:hypothetical protein